MPFTVSHTAAALPFFRTNLSKSALVIGTMVPDIPIFTSFGLYELSHSFSGLVLYNLPIGVLVWILWTYVLRTPTFALCPLPLRKPLFSKAYTPEYYTILLSILIGSATHQLWDGFTHRTAFGVRHFPMLLNEFAGYPLYSWLQFTSSVFGLCVLGFWLGKKWDRTQFFSQQSLVRIVAIPLAMLFVAVFYAVQVRRLNNGIVFMYGVVITSTKIMVSCYIGVIFAFYFNKFSGFRLKQFVRRRP
jgi:hypothetical protein